MYKFKLLVKLVKERVNFMNNQCLAMDFKGVKPIKNTNKFESTKNINRA